MGIFPQGQQETRKGRSSLCSQLGWIFRTPEIMLCNLNNGRRYWKESWEYAWMAKQDAKNSGYPSDDVPMSFK